VGAATPRAWAAAGAGAAALAALAAAATVVAYAASPAIAVVGPVVLAVAVAVVLRPMTGILLATLAAPLEYLDLRVGGAGLSAAELLFVGSAAAVLLHWALDAAPPRVGLAHLAFAGLIATAATGLLFAPDTVIATKVVVMWSSFLVLSVRMANATARELRWLLLAITAAAAVVAAMALADGGDLRLVGGGTAAENRATGSFSHPNILAFFLVLALPVSLALGLASRGLQRLPCLAASGLVLAALMLTLSRGAMIGAAVSLLVLAHWATFRRVAVGLLVVIAAFAALNLDAIRQSREVSVVSQRLSTVSQERRTNPRLRIYAKAPTMVADRPFLGVGEGNFSQYAGPYGLRDVGGDLFEHAHNVPLTIAVETGLIGLACFLTFAAGALAAAVRVLRARGWPGYPFGLALVAGLSAVAVNAALDYPLRANYVMALIMLEVGALMAFARSAGRG
jgi:O-antigen ligase